MESRQKKTELQILADFLATSQELKNMRSSAKQCPDTIHYEGHGTDYQGMKAVATRPEQETVDKIDKATSFAELLNILKQLDFAQNMPHQSDTAKSLAQTGMKIAGYFGGFFSNHANFSYYEMCFLEKVKQTIADNNLQVSTAPQASM